MTDTEHSTTSSSNQEVTWANFLNIIPSLLSTFLDIGQLLLLNLLRLLPNAYLFS